MNPACHCIYTSTLGGLSSRLETANSDGALGPLPSASPVLVPCEHGRTGQLTPRRVPTSPPRYHSYVSIESMNYYDFGHCCHFA